jgi:hypothetical protein
MSDDLYFVKILARALRQPRCRPALLRAFGEIEAMAEDPCHRRGYQQYMIFMGGVRGSLGAQRGLATGDRTQRGLERPHVTGLVVERNGEPIAHFDMDGSPMARMLTGIGPGHYSLGLDSGRALWEGDLTEAHLLWDVACPGAPLPMAADTGETTAASTLEVPLLDGTLWLRSYPGVGAGYVGIEVTTQGEAKP